MGLHDLIKDLEKKLALYRDKHTWRIASPNPIHEKIAHYVSIAQLYPRPLNRQNVTALLEGRDSWPTVEGAAFCLAHTVDVAELEQARVIGFPNDDLIVLPRVPSSPDMPPKLRHQLDAHNVLYEIKYFHDEFESPHLWIEQSSVDPADMPLLQENLKTRGEGYRLKVKREDVVGVGTYLWKRLIDTSGSPDAAFAEYVAKMRLAVGHSYIFEIDFEQDIDILQYLECAFNFIAADKTLFESWEKCAADVAINHNRIDSIIKIRSPIELHVRPSQPEQVSQQTERYSEALDISLANSIICNLASRPPTTLLEGAEWWREAGDYRYAGRETASEHLVSLIIRHEHNLYSPRDSFPITRKLIKLSLRSPKLAGALFSDTTYPPYLCFLLSNVETNYLGLIRVYRDLERHQRPISEKVPYEKMWNDIVWAQALEVFNNSYDENLHISALPSAVDQLCEMLAWFASHELGYNARHKLIDDTRLPSLRNALSAIKYLNESGSFKNLVADHYPLFCDRVIQRLSNARLANGKLPLGEWFTLFWCMDWALGSPNRHKETSNGTIEPCDVLIDSYLSILNERLKGDANATDDPLAFDELEWHKVYASASPEQRERWINALDNQEAIEATKDLKKSRDIVFAARMHFRLLLQLYNYAEHEAEKRRLADKIIAVIKQFGFGPGGYSGVFDYLHDNSDYSPVRLWPALCSAANSFTPEEFQRLITILRWQEAPLSALFVLLEGTAPFSNKQLTIGLIAERNLEAASPNWTPEAFNIILKAANNGQMKIAREYLDFVKEHAHRTFENKTTEISAKLDLKDIFDNKKLSSEEKINDLRQFSINSEERQVINEVQSFRRYLIASLTIYVDQVKALEMFSKALDTERTLQNATGLIKVVLSWQDILDLPAPLEFYLKRWLDTYEATLESDLKVQLNDVELNYILQLCLATSHLDDFKRFWSQASNQQRMAYELAPLRAEYLKRTAGNEESLAYLRELRKIHQSLPQDALEEFSAIEEGLMIDGAVVITKQQPPAAPEIDSFQDKLRLAWLSIRDLDAYDQSQIFMHPTEQIDNYLLELVEQVGLELLKRNGNLQRKKTITPSPSTILLDDEDMINDWFVSLVCQRMNFVGWTMKDQSRIGRSGTEKGVGETDGWVKDGRGNQVFLFEAFRLGHHIDTTVINKHLHKISNYNSAGMSPIFIVVYAACNEFKSLCAAYKDHVEKLDYEGFEPGHNSGLRQRKPKMPSVNAEYFEETRQINGKEISIYHHLLHFKPPK